jgi:Tfp pilus assembly protein FimV
MTRARPARRVCAVLCGAALIGVAGAASALGIGEPEVRSHIGQPLAVHIPLQLPADEPLENVALSLPAEAAYAAFALPSPQGLRSMRIEGRV